MKLICGVIWSCQGSPFYPMASVGAEELRSTHRGFRRIEGGNTRKYSSESPEGLGIRQDDPCMSKTASITGCAGK